MPGKKKKQTNKLLQELNYSRAPSFKQLKIILPLFSSLQLLNTKHKWAALHDLHLQIMLIQVEATLNQ